MSTVTTTSLSDTLPSSIPKLDASSINWAIFSIRFQDAIEAKGFWNHFDGKSIRPEQVYSAVDTAADGSTSGGTAIIPEDEPENPRLNLNAYTHEENRCRKVERHCHRIHRERGICTDRPSPKIPRAQMPFSGQCPRIFRQPFNYPFIPPRPSCQFRIHAACCCLYVLSRKDNFPRHPHIPD